MVQENERENHFHSTFVLFCAGKSVTLWSEKYVNSKQNITTFLRKARRAFWFVMVRNS